jgi:hypothetical protein
MISLLLAAALVPLSSMTESNRALVQPVIEQSTLRRDYPAKTFRGHREQFEFLMDHFAACSALSEALGLIRYRVVEDDPDRVVGDDGEGGRGHIQQVYCAEGQRIYYVDGSQQGVLQAHGSGVVVVQFTQATPDTIEYTGQMLVKIDNPVVATLAQVFFVFVKSAVDWHFNHVISQPVNLSGFALDDPSMIRDCVERMPAEDYRRLAPFVEPLRR